MPPQTVFPVFTFIIETLGAAGYLDGFRSYNNNLLCALDGTQYFSSKTIHCDNCNTKEHKNGSITYSHSALTPVLLKPGCNKVISYRFVNQVPLRDGEDARMVNWCELTTTRFDGAIGYKNAFATNFEISKNNVTQIIADGRACWKIENENKNIPKNRGYHLEHNFGHGKKYLSQPMLTLNLLAFLFYTVLEMLDKKYELVRSELPTRQTFFDDIRALIRIADVPRSILTHKHPFGILIRL